MYVLTTEPIKTCKIGGSCVFRRWQQCRRIPCGVTRL